MFSSLRPPCFNAADAYPTLPPFSPLILILLKQSSDSALTCCIDYTENVHYLNSSCPLSVFSPIVLFHVAYLTHVSFSVHGNCRGEVSPLAAGKLASDHIACAGHLGEERRGMN